MRASRTNKQRHASLLGGTVAFAAIAGLASGDEIFPCVSAPLTAGDYMVYGQVMGGAAVRAAEAIPPKDILSRKGNVLIRDGHIPHQPNNTWKRILSPHGTELAVGTHFYDFGFLLEYEHDSPFPTRDVDGLVVVVKDEDRHSSHFRLNNEIFRYQSTKAVESMRKEPF